MASRYILFFSGGSALGDTAAALAEKGHGGAHVITTFDSGGSSAILRRAFNMPAIGDLRARLLSLSDLTKPGVGALCSLLQYRLPFASDIALHKEFSALIGGGHALYSGVRPTATRAIRKKLGVFREHMPPAFSFAGASVGNLVFAAEYLSASRSLTSAISEFGSLVQARGQVAAVADASAHLAVALEDGQIITGQHKFTGKHAAAIASPVRRIWLARGEHDPFPVAVSTSEEVCSLIRNAACIVFPIGSFYSSIIANLLVGGVRAAIAEARCPKVFIPNPGPDPELFGRTTKEQVSFLLFYLCGAGTQADLDAGGYTSSAKGGAFTECGEASDALKNRCMAGGASALLSHILVSEDTAYPGGIPEKWLSAQGIKSVHVSSLQRGPMVFDGERLAEVLLSFL